MPEWEGIQDNSATCPFIWFSRVSETDSWEPLRKVDCVTLNEKSSYSGNNDEEVLIDSGRASVNLKTLAMKYNFFKYPSRQLCRANWFIVKNTKSPVQLEPVLPLYDCLAIESLYRKVVSSTGSLSSNKRKLQEVLKYEVMLNDEKNPGKYKARVILGKSTNNSEKFSMRKQETGFTFSNIMSNGVLLQRGYSKYTVDGEEEELMLGPPNHLVFVIHGIGETMWSASANYVPSLKGEVNKLRKNMQSEQVALWKKCCEEKGNPVNAKKDTGNLLPPNRVELIPIEWYDRIHSSSNTLMKNLHSTTLETIPVFRKIANDVVFDVLMYLSPQYCREVLEEVTSQINSQYKKFVQIHGDGGSWNGKISIIGHSLGSVIAWDLLSMLKQSTEMEQVQEVSQQRKSYLPPLDRPLSQVINFQPHFTIFLGSPLGLFLSLRGPQDISGNTFTLPTKYAYNIFHPSDPVAYRIEPLLNEIYPKDPHVLTTEIRGMRLHYKAEAIRKGVKNEISKNLIGLDYFLKKNIPTDNVNIKQENDKQMNKNRSSTSLSSTVDEDLDVVFSLSGGSPRVDYALQMDITEQEYISALSAHTSYFTNDDFIHFLIERTSID